MDIMTIHKMTESPAAANIAEKSINGSYQYIIVPVKNSVDARALLLALFPLLLSPQYMTLDD